VRVTDEAYVLKNRGTAQIGPARTNLMGAVPSILIPTVFLLQRGGWTRMEAPAGAPRQVALSHSCWKPHRQSL